MFIYSPNKSPNPAKEVYHYRFFLFDLSVQFGKHRAFTPFLKSSRIDIVIFPIIYDRGVIFIILKCYNTELTAVLYFYFGSKNWSILYE